MNLSQFKAYSFYDDSFYNQVFENVTPRKTRPYRSFVSRLPSSAMVL